jgi:hypothetical protein
MVRVTDGAEDDVGGVAGATFEIAAAEMALCFHIVRSGANHSLSARLLSDE